MQIDEAREFIKFLHGAVPWNGTWFGEYAPGEKGAYWWRKHLDEAIAALIAAPAAPQQAEPVGYFVNDESDDQWHQVDYEQRNGADTYPLYLHPPADEVQQAEPVAQIGWADEFGNIFPMGAWKPAQRTHHDSHKTAWRPVFLHPPAAEVQLLRDAVAKLSTIVRVPNAEHIADEHNAAVAFLRRALEGGE